MKDILGLLNEKGIVKICCPGAKYNTTKEISEFSSGDPDQEVELMGDRISQRVIVKCAKNDFPGNCVKGSQQRHTPCPYEAILRTNDKYHRECNPQIVKLKKDGEVWAQI